jgi:hypothetical protein
MGAIAAGEGMSASKHMIRLDFEDNNTGHNDLVLRFPGGEHRCDTYYFAIDGKFDPDDESHGKIVRVLHALVRQWLDLVRNATEDDVIFLPFDFSDQCTGWVRCTFDGESVQLDVGWSGIEGWSFSPSNISERAHKVPDFHGIENRDPIVTNRGSLVAAIEANMKQYSQRTV